MPGGLLGADYAVENGRYRFKKVYGGLNWNPQLRAPLTEPGVNVAPASICSPWAASDVRPPANIYSFFENTAGKIVEITVGPNADGSGVAHGAGRADRERGRAAQSRLGRGQPEEGRRGDRRARRLRLRPQHRAARLRLLQALLLSADRTRTPSSSTSASTAAARSRTTTSTSSAGRSSATGRCATATI